jgi:uncharacterized oxidoreductase
MPTLSAAELREFAVALLRALGTPQGHADVVADVLIEANLAGHDSHGIIRLPQYARAVRAGPIRPDAPPQVVRETPATAVVSGQMNFGHVTLTYALDVALAKAAQTAVATVLVRECNHVGRLGGYAARAARLGFACQIGVNCPGARSVAPWGGIDRRLGTNPLCLAAPGRAGPLVIDMTTSVVAEGKVRVLHHEGKPAPPDWLIDHDGRPTTDTAEFYGRPAGALLPLGGSVGYKGHGLGLLLDVLCGSLSGQGAVRPDLQPGHNGVWLSLWQVAAFTDWEAYLEDVDRLAAWVKTSRRAPGVDEILLPGEIETRTAARRAVEGIPVAEETWKQLVELAHELGVTAPP